MFKKKLFCAGPVSRCRFAPLLLLACLAFAFSSSLQAQEHGAGLTKVCGPPARTCDTASDCADGDLCTDDVCTDSPANTLYNCTFTFRHLDEFGDTLSLYDAFDTITNNVGAPTVIPLADLLVIAISGNATCSGVNAGALPAAANTVLPCAVGPATTIPVAISGRVQFRSNTYSPTMADYNAITPELDGRVLLRDSATGKAKDLCDAVGTAGCNTVDDIVATGVSSQEIVTGCENPPSECDDGNACTTEACNPDTGQCEVTDEVACDDGDACTSEACDPADGVCKTTDEVACDDGDACTSEACDPADGVCKTTDEVACDDGDACTSEACDPADGVCKTTDEVACDDGDACTSEACDPADGVCKTTDEVACDDGDACTSEACDPADGVCKTTDEVACDDGDACTSEACDPADGVCKTTDEVACDDGDACTSEACDPADGVCKTTDEVACDDGDACTSEACDPADGVCKTTDEVACDDGDVCTDDSCNPDTGLCVSVPAEDPPAECLGAEICRTPGFWGTHGGTEKRNSTNITQAVIDEAGGLLVCGESITDTHLGHTHSALEAICVSVKGAQELQLARQLTAAALNCVMSGGPADCTGISIEELYADCNVACVGGDSDRSITECIEEVDCFNNGGEFVAGECKTGVGTCDVSGAACDDDTPCTGLGDTMCVPFETCHDRDLCPDFTDDGELNGSDFCFEPPGAAGSSGACNAATKNTLSIFD